MRGIAICKVVASKAPSFAVGEYATALTGWTELCVVAADGSDRKSLTKISIPEGGKATDSLGVLGTTGLTAYFGLLDVGKVKAGDYVVVSGAAGATGSVVCQIAKLKGAKVMGIAGSDDKVQWLKELGCDEALNYKDANFKADFKAKTKDFIDVFFDNVGGEVLELALSRAKAHARFVICGGAYRMLLWWWGLANSFHSYQPVQLGCPSWTQGRYETHREDNDLILIR